MISVDANILLFAYGETSPFHGRAQAFLDSLSRRSDVAISEFVLTEFYLHLRNPAVFARPLSPAEALTVVNAYRLHPRWRVLGFPPHSREIHASLWTHAGSPGFARRRIYDVRTALCTPRVWGHRVRHGQCEGFPWTGFYARLESPGRRIMKQPALRPFAPSRYLQNEASIAPCPAVPSQGLRPFNECCMRWG